MLLHNYYHPYQLLNMSADPFGGHNPHGLRQPGQSLQEHPGAGSPDPQLGGSGYGSSEGGSISRGPLTAGLDFLRGLGSGGGDKKNRGELADGFRAK